MALLPLPFIRLSCTTMSKSSEMPFLDAYKAFRGVVALHKTSIGKVSQKLWCYYDFGPKDVVPLICLPGIAGTADVFFNQVMELSSKGYRVISVQHAPYMSFVSLLKGLDLLIERLKIPKCHMMGEGFGGYLAQCYAQYRPVRVASLILCNSYCDLQHFIDSSPFTGFLSWMPDALMKRSLVSDLRYQGPNLDLVKAYKFVSHHSKRFDTDDLCSRLTLQYLEGPLKPKEFPVPDEAITIIDTDDPICFPDRVRLEVHKFYPNAKEVQLPSGGTFPFLSRPTDFNAAVEQHLTLHGVSLTRLFGTPTTETTPSLPIDPSSSSVSAASPIAQTSTAPSYPNGTVSHVS